MSETAKFYTAEQKDVLKEYSVSKDAKRTLITESTGARILDALGEQQNMLQNIEHILQRIEEVILSALKSR
ncbi:hypothetical protein E5329_07765 [Petralouisia muris]|jgi:hypothetical protein|uniref:Uncharacterized protein n=1 Tax=Petralouisia muris TaxID=3032872 RepID=A0AC61RYR2_9FIRM|nr:hypothetical protein E5329_07765 [Petralouisia muris]